MEGAVAPPISIGAAAQCIGLLPSFFNEFKNSQLVKSRDELRLTIGERLHYRTN